MAVIVQSDPYKALIRKIGYSVGLESIMSRATALVELYVEQRSLSIATWRKLVVDVFHRKETDSTGKKSGAGHIADFFSTLNLLRVTNQSITPLHGLEVLSILWRYLETSDERQTAMAVVLSVYLLEADGDIFLNLLNTEFDEELGCRALEQMVSRKRDLLTTVIRHPALQQKIFDVVSIKTHAQPKRAPGPGSHEHSPFSRRQQPLSDSKRSLPLSGSSASPVTVSDDYIRKALQTRKGWARDLGLFSEAATTEDGTRILGGLRNIGLWDHSGVFLFWPYERDLRRLQIDPAALGSRALSEWDVLTSIAASRYGLPVAAADTQQTEHLIKRFRDLHRLYKEGNRVAGTIRHLLPLYVAQPVVVASCVARNTAVPPIPALIASELVSPERTIQFGNIRGTEGGIAVREKK